MAQYCASQLSTKVDSQCDKLVTVIKVHAFIVISITSRTKHVGEACAILTRLIPTCTIPTKQKPNYMHGAVTFTFIV